MTDTSFSQDPAQYTQNFFDKILSAMTSGRTGRVAKFFGKSFTLLGAEGIRDIIVGRIAFSGLWTLVNFLAFLGLVYQVAPVASWCALFVSVLIIWPYSFFYHVNRRARQVYLAYARITGKTATISDAAQIAKDQKWSLRLFSFVEIALASASREGRPNTIIAMLTAAVLAILEGIYDVAESYLLPALMIEKLSLKQSAEKLKDLKSKVPEALAGAFGSDLLGGLAGGLLGLVFVGLALVGIGLGLLIPHMVTMKAAVIVFNQPDGFSFFYVPVVAALFLSSFIRSIVNILASSLKAIYFGVFYTAINKPQEISPSLRDQIVAYLQN